MTDARYIISERKYSILSEVQEWPHSGKYEFLLQYPELEGYNRWKQTNFPLSEAYYQGKQEVEGYENVSITWTTRQWAGLQNSTGCSLLEGSISVTNWYYAIGKYGYQYHNLMEISKLYHLSQDEFLIQFILLIKTLL